MKKYILLLILTLSFNYTFSQNNNCVDDDLAMGPIDCVMAVDYFGCSEINIFTDVLVSDACPVTCDSCPEDCADDDTLMTPMDCATVVSIFGCEGSWNGITVSEACPETCDACQSPLPSSWGFTVTDANMTIQVGAGVVTFNGSEPPLGSLLGVFFTNDDGDLQCAGYQAWTGDQLAIAAMASESGLDNGFAAGESFTWGLQVDGESYSAENISMNSSTPFIDTFISNGFAQLTSADFVGEITFSIGCTDPNAENYDSNATINFGCIYPGCTNPEATNYDSNATEDDGSCIVAPWSIENDITGCNTTLGIEMTASASIDGSPINNGDVIGVFFTDLDGNLACGGLAVWNGENLAIPVWGDDMTTENIKEGFLEGEEITFQIWNSTTGEIVDNVIVEFLLGDNIFECNGTILLNSIEGITIITQEILIPEGWFIFSTYLNLNDDISEVFASIIDDLVIIKNDEGNVFWPELNINNIGTLIDGEGYELKMSSSNSLYLESYQLAENTINVPIGWSMIAYTNQEPGSSYQNLSPYSDNFSILKNYEGNVFWPELGIDQINILNPGWGYWIFSENNFNIYYQDVDARLSHSTEAFKSQKFNKPVNTGHNMVIGIKESCWGLNIQEGDEVVVCDGEGNIFGNAPYKKNGTVITVWGNDPTTINKDGLINGEKLYFKLYRHIHDELIDLKILSWQNGGGYFSINGISVVEKVVINNELNEVKKLIKITDILGKNINDYKNNEMLIYIYDDGSVEKKYVIE